MQGFSFSGNWVDLVIIIFTLIYVGEGWQRGFVALFFELASFVGAFAVALKLYPWVSVLLVNNFSLSVGLSNAMSFLALGLLTEQIFTQFADSLYGRIPTRWLANPANKILSIIPLIGNVVIILAFLLTLILSVPIRGDIKAAVSQSKLAQPIIAKTQNIERVLGGVFGAAIQDTLNFVTIQPSSEETVKLNFKQPDVTLDATSEVEMLVRVNKERRDRSLKELTVDPRLRDLARAYARDMFLRGYFSHYNPEGESPFDRMKQAGISYQSAGENLAYAPNITIAHEGLMNSPGHRANILSPDFGRVGIGVIDGGIYGKMFVQEFTN